MDIWQFFSGHTAGEEHIDTEKWTKLLLAKLQTVVWCGRPWLKPISKIGHPRPIGHLFFKKWANPASLSFIFGLFQTNINKFLQQINVKKCPSSIRHRDSNPRPSERESPPITTRPDHLFICLCSAFSNNFTAKNVKNWVVVVAQLVERLL